MSWLFWLVRYNLVVEVIQIMSLYYFILVIHYSRYCHPDEGRIPFVITLAIFVIYYPFKWVGNIARKFTVFNGLNSRHPKRLSAVSYQPSADTNQLLLLSFHLYKKKTMGLIAVQNYKNQKKQQLQNLSSKIAIYILKASNIHQLRKLTLTAKG